MRATLMLRLASAALALLALPDAAWASAVRDRAVREIVIAFAPSPSGALAVDIAAGRAARLSALALTPRRTLADALIKAGVSEARLASARGAGISGPGLAATERASRVFGLDPAAVLLAEAPDEAAASRALAVLQKDPGIAWVEMNRVRALAGWIADGVYPGAALDWNGALGSRTPRERDARPGAALAAIPPFPNDPLFQDGGQWSFFNVGPTGPFRGADRADVRAAEAWAVTKGSNDLILASGDTGVDPSHPDLAGLMPNGMPRLLAPVNITGLESAPGFVDSIGHGTLTSGVFAARSNNGASLDTLGMAGLCGGDGAQNAGCRLVAIKITVGRSTEATSFDVAAAVLYAASMGARAMNLSFAGTEPSRVERMALYEAITRGCVLVGAAGNDGNPVAQYPAAYAVDDLCIQVGATNQSDQRTAYSSYGPGLDLMAPGEYIYSTFPTYPNAYNISYPGYVPAAGTSLAAPHVTGAVGLLATLRPELLENDFQHIVRESAHDIGDPGVDYLTGWGRLDLEAALAAVDTSLGIWHGEVAGTLGAVVGAGALSLDESTAAAPDHGRTWPQTEEIEVTAAVAIPDSFIQPVRVWPRVGGTFTVRAGFSLPYFAPWAEILDQSATSFTLRGYVYHRTDVCTACDEYLPFPPEDMRFGFTVIGRVRRGAAVPLRAIQGPLAVTPNPATGWARIIGTPGAEVIILDMGGRRVRRATLDGSSGTWSWDGLDDRGRRVAAGVYLIRTIAGTRVLERKLVRLE